MLYKQLEVQLVVYISLSMKNSLGTVIKHKIHLRVCESVTTLLSTTVHLAKVMSRELKFKEVTIANAIINSKKEDCIHLCRPEDPTLESQS